MALFQKAFIIQLVLLSLFLCASYGIRIDDSKLPVQTEFQNEKSEDPYLKAICTAQDRCKNKMCTKHLAQGCTCYNNGTCIEGMVNRCIDCTNPDIFAVVEGNGCPKRYPKLCPPLEKSKTKCSSTKYPSCVCKTNGACKMEKTNSCIGCRKASVLAVFQDQTCPASRLQLKDSTEC